MANAPRTLSIRRHAPLLLGALLIIAMSVSLAWQTADWIRLLRHAPTVQSAAPATLTTRALENLDSLFGASGPASSAPPPSTNLRLTLRGSFVNANAQHSSAIIQREGSKPERFIVGSEIDSGVRLHGVYRDRVELERAGRLETLTFPTRRSTPPAASAPTDSTADELSALQDENAAELRERMESLRQQMEAAGTLPAEEAPSETPPEPPTESD
ncbi:type II secretion system protein N [Zestomonas insulae]|uniref:type II secretion system protein N n=1 Tax=Zestomonas insulae TaxID=2809017 RepID=UPI001EF5B23D|nr:type II secretion system protein N [Pseudomonas insulae]